MVNVNNFFNNQNIKTTAELGGFKVLEYQKDITMNPAAAAALYFCDKMGVRKRQVAIELRNTGVVVQSGAMQWTLGNVESSTGIKGAGDLVGKMFKGAVTGESAIKPEYKGQGLLVLEPTYKFVLLEDVGQWNGGLVLQDGLFLASDNTIKQTLNRRSNLSSAVAGGEGLFNLCLSGQGVAALESPVPREELVEINLENDMVRIDGNYAVAWSGSLQFTVERSSKSLIGSAVNGEGLVNVYRGTGRILMAPVDK
jgi:uncharacterized protein (AIM24 family)